MYVYVDMCIYIRTSHNHTVQARPQGGFGGFERTPPLLKEFRQIMSKKS